MIAIVINFGIILSMRRAKLTLLLVLSVLDTTKCSDIDDGLKERSSDVELG